ncbi:putative UPF0764 protein C16orf89 homolog [Trypoxylus dichotomus]
MSKVAVGALLYLYLISVAYCKHHDYTDQVIGAMERTIHYMKMKAELMNLDAVFGLVLAQANLQQLMQEGVTDIIRPKIRRLEFLANETVHRIKPYLGKAYKNQLFSETVLIPKAWRRKIEFKPKALNMSFIERVFFDSLDTIPKYIEYLKTSDITESESDNCYIELLQQHPHCCEEHKCGISANCELLMIRHIRNVEPAYGATHSLLYLQIARSQECRFNRVYFGRKMHVYCSYIYWEALKNQEFGFLVELDDLLLEQVTLCGYEGFIEVLTDPFIEHILSLQAKSGCFKLNQENTREKRESNLLDHGCADHTTGLGVSALSVILRYQLTTS